MNDRVILWSLLVAAVGALIGVSILFGHPMPEQTETVRVPLMGEEW